MPDLFVTSRLKSVQAALLAGVAALLLPLAPPTQPPADTDPVHDLARVRLIVKTTASSTNVTVDGATVASYASTVIGGATGSRSSQTGSTLGVANSAPGQDLEAQFDVILAGVSGGGDVRWNVAIEGAGAAELDVYSANDAAAPRLVDRFAATGARETFSTSIALLDAHGRLSAGRVPKLVLAHYYPWYTRETWNDPQLADRPAQVYSTDDRSDVEAVTRQARSAGIDVFVVSWQGRDVGDGVNDRRMRVVLNAAHASNGLRIAAFTETLAANPRHDPSGPTDPDTIFSWLADIVDSYGPDPSYLRIEGRPVIFVYSCWQLAPEEWLAVRAKLRASGRDPLLIGDFYHSTEIGAFDGEYQYSNVTLSPDQLDAVDRTESLRVRTYHLLRANDRRRIWIATVVPGYDDSRLANRATHLVVDRDNGRLYDTQWAVALDTAADWVMVTSWNEWWENTEIEPGLRYGSLFLDRTRVWIRAFRNGQPSYLVPFVRPS